MGTNAKMDVPEPRDPPQLATTGAENGTVEAEVDAVAGDVGDLKLGEGNSPGDGPPGDASIEQQNATTLSPEGQCSPRAYFHPLTPVRLHQTYPTAFGALYSKRSKRRYPPYPHPHSPSPPRYSGPIMFCQQGLPNL